MNKEEITRRTEDNDEEIMKEKTNNEEIKVELGLSLNVLSFKLV